MVRAEQMLAQEADAIWASSHALAEHHRRHAGKLSLVLNGLTQPPPFHAQRKASRPVLGYLGVMDRWFDWERVIALARAYPQAIFQLVGPVHTGPAGPLPANIECLPPVPQHQVYDTLARFQVGMIPFVCNDVTDYVDPVKYYEYRAMGLPVLSTRFGEMNHRHAQDGVHFWDALETGKLTLQALIDAGLDASQQRHFCEENTWQKRFDAVSESLSGPL
jgi:hypothetical protein